MKLLNAFLQINLYFPVPFFFFTSKHQELWKALISKTLVTFDVLFLQGSKEDEVKLELITYVGLSLSSVGCFITFIVYLALRWVN